MSRRKRILMGALLPAAAAAIWGFWPAAESLQPFAEAHRQAATYPDYSGIVIPPNVAPLNLKVQESGRKFCLRLACQAGRPVEVFSANPNIAIPLAPWRRLLEANAGGELRMDIYVEGERGWTHFDTVRNRIAADPIDPYVVYRYLPPVYDKWGRMSLRQRDLRSFEERVLFDNQRIGGACFNCHTFLNHRTGQMLLQFRPGSGSSHGPAMILVRNGRAEKVDTRVAGKGGAAAYIAWHPSGKLLAFSRNSLAQIFHTAGVEVREVVDRDSDLGLYAVDTGQVYTVPEISRPDRLETFPTWSPDGRYLYFCSAPALADKRTLLLQFDKVQYDLVRIAYDAASGRWGHVETVVAAARLGKSISLPQISPDGRFLMFCGHDYGSFPIFQPSSDLYMLDLSLVGTPAGAAQRFLPHVVRQWPLGPVLLQAGRRPVRPPVHRPPGRWGPFRQALRVAAAGPRVLRPVPDDLQPARAPGGACDSERRRIGAGHEFRRGLPGRVVGRTLAAVEIDGAAAHFAARVNSAVAP